VTVSDLTRVRALVELVHDLPPEERRRVLARECGSDPELRREVEELLGTVEAEPDFLARAEHLPGAAELGRPAAPELARDVDIGGFRLVARIATGGMGSVWEAEQDSPRRKVALKALRFADLSPEATRRFRRESEILARLRHPNIAQVFAAGVHPLPGGESLPWYALEFVESAETLTAFVRGRSLELWPRMELFVELCSAVQHAHERGVVHRDLKPSNVLVDQAGHLKVIDFGVARERAPGARSESFQTEAGRVFGTLQYMAPEQVSGASDQADARADVYSLGVILYELATDQVPYDLAGASLARAARIVTEHTPRRPGALVPRLPGDLDAIVLKALEKDPARRYATAAALADDIERLALGRPVSARAPGATYQLRLFARRHRVLVSAAVGVVLVSLAAAVVSVSYAARAGAAQGVATRRFEQVRGLARWVLFELHDSIEHLAGATQARRKLADEALVYLDALELEARDDPGLLSEVAEGRLRLGEVLGAPGHASLGELEAGAREVQHALSTVERLLASSPSREARLLRVRARLVLSDFEREAGRATQALELATMCEGEIAELSRSDAAAGLERSVGDARSRRAKALVRLGRSDEALAVLRDEADRLRLACERDADAVDAWRDAALARIDLGILLLQRARPAEAVSALDDALACAEEHQRRNPQDAQAASDLALGLAWRGNARAEAGDVAGGLADNERAVRLRRELVASDPNDATAVQDLSFSCSRLGMAREAAGDREGALAAYQEALVLSRQRLARSPDGFAERLAVASDEEALFESLRGLDRFGEGRAALERALDLLLDLEASHPRSIEVARKLGTTLARLADEARGAGRLDEALERYAAASERIQRAASADPEHAWTRRMVMVLHCWRGVAHKAAAEQSAGEPRSTHFTRAIEAFEAALAEEPRLARAGFLQEGDDHAVSLVRADLEACRRSLEDSPAR